MRVEIVAAVLTISDSASRGERLDRSGPAVVAEIEKLGGRVAAKEILPDDGDLISAKLREYADAGEINLILTTGGTGFSARDNTPEATRAVIEKEAPGLAEAMRSETLKNTPFAMLSRGISGIRNQTLIVNLPGSPKAVQECFDVIKPVLEHAVNLLKGNTKH